MECQIIVNTPMDEAYLYVPNKFIIGSLNYDRETQGCKVDYEKGLAYLDENRDQTLMRLHSFRLEHGVSHNEFELLRTVDLTDEQMKELIKQGRKLEHLNENKKAKQLEWLDGIVQEILSQGNEE